MQRELCGYADVANPFSILLLGWPAVLISDDIYSISNYGCSDKQRARVRLSLFLSLSLLLTHSHTHV